MNNKKCDTTVNVPLKKYKELERAYDLITSDYMWIRDSKKVEDWEKKFDDNKTFVGNYTFYMPDDYRFDDHLLDAIEQHLSSLKRQRNYNDEDISKVRKLLNMIGL